MVTRNELWDTLKSINYPGLQFHLVMKGPLYFLQVVNPYGVDSRTGQALSWKGRKWYISDHMTKSEIVQTAFKAVLTAMEHEARESFTFKGVPVCDPHLDLEDRALKRSTRDDA